jgi:hypothetical protein
MDLKQLKAVGGFASSKLIPVKKIWETPDGEKVDIEFFVIRRSFGQAEQFYKLTQEKKDISVSSTLISEAVRLGKDGKERLTYEQAYELEPSLATLFFEGINEASSPKKANSEESSGTS